MGLETLKKWNPWWVSGTVPAALSGIERDEDLGALSKLISAKEMVAVTGVRRCGKSTLLFQLIGSLLKSGVNPTNIFYFNFDDPGEDNSPKTPDAAYNSYRELNNPSGRQYVLFDEIQNVKGWEKWVKAHYDLQGRDVKFFVTGSNTSMLSDSLSKLLTGRMLPYEVYPLSFREYLSFVGFKLEDEDTQKTEIKHHLGRYLEVGGFPEAVLDRDSDINSQRLREYFNSILFRDIIMARGIKESAKLAELTKYVSTNVAGTFSYNKISKVINLNINTMKEYLHFLQQAYLVFQVNHFSYSLKESLALQKPKKVYFIDNGMRNATAVRHSKDEGKLAENTVFLELKRRGCEVNFWKGKNEVDFVAKSPDGALKAINVTYGDEVGPRETKGLIEFSKQHKGAELLIITRDAESDQAGVKLTPLWKWLIRGPEKC